MEPYEQRAILDAIVQIPRRAERQHHESLADTFVEIGSLFTSLKRPEHQIIYGRRGTGKTHALGRLEAELHNRGTWVVSIDFRTIGSASGLYFDPGADFARQATTLLVDVVEAIHAQVLGAALQEIESGGSAEAVVDGLDALARTATEVEVTGPIESEESVSRIAKSSDSIGMEVSVAPEPKLGLSAHYAREAELSQSSTTRAAGEVRFALKLGPLSNSLRQIVDNVPNRELWLLFDEWSSVPVELQPFLADLLRRAAFPVRGLVVKIAAIERRSKFAMRGVRGNYIGLELGADASQDVNLDDYLIFRSESDRAQRFFADLFLKHGMLIEPEIFGQIANGSPWSLMRALCKGDAFAELVQAAEGVPRDGINIAGLAAQAAGSREILRSGWDGPISVSDVRDAARAWYLRDKEGAILGNHLANRALGNITAFVARRRKRTFLLRRGHESGHEVIQDLYDARLVHLLANGVGPDGAYDLFALDYGGYAKAIAEGETAFDWVDRWQLRWNELDPTRSPEVGGAILEIGQVLARRTT